MGESRVLHFEKELSVLGYRNALAALDWMKEEMCSEKGYSRHDGSHYYHHLVAVAQDLLDNGIREEDIITAALLHDSIEDIPGVNCMGIIFRFGHNVAEMVGLVTKKGNIDYKCEDNLDNYLSEISKNIGASLIKTADRKHNFGTLNVATAEKKLKQAIETENYFIPFFKVCRNKYPRYASYFFSAKTTIEPHLWEIKEHYEEVKKLEEKIEQLQNKL